MFDWENAIALHAMQGNRASSRGEGEVSWIFSSCGYAVVYTIYCIVYTVSMLSLHVDRSSGELELSQTGLQELIVNFSEILRTGH